MLETSVNEAVTSWLGSPAIAEADRAEIRRLVEAGNESELTDRFYTDLSFGTGGLRGVLGAGRNRMNVYTVGAAAQGLADYIARAGDTARSAGVAIAHDCRRMSREFALRTALVMAGNGIKAYVFEKLRPTPELSFAVRHLNCTSGIVITASHNPPEYNGFKAYWRGGAQVVPPHDQGIIDAVRAVGGFENVRVADESDARSNGLLIDIGDAIDEAYLDHVRESCLNPTVCREYGDKIKIVYTSLHGTGGQLIPKALNQRGFTRVLEVAEQAKPDGEFPTVKSPNPEEPAALAMGIALAKRASADLVIGTDPDADRVGMAVRDKSGDYVHLTGNRIAALLTWYVCEQHKHRETMPRHGVVLSTIVSSDEMKVIARSYGVEVIETLTGFKWIAEQMAKFDEEHGESARTFLFGAEESYGYLPVSFVRDKDAVASTTFVAEAAAYAAAMGKSLLDILDDLAARFGLYREGAKSITLKGKRGADQILDIMASFRREAPREIGGVKVLSVGDLMSGEIVDRESRERIAGYELPAADVIVLTLADETKVIARPSGTEPKIKFYILVREPGDDLPAAEAAAAAKIARIERDVQSIVDGILA
ncbi:MAG: phospho-sugar mutase [Phycisphaerales bacterium]|nr:phospho-sugar mutase [Phycisphaerales bacterium]MCB9854258.1 phospho-sugar mutase [Phycisphaerales bacterium]MCB9864734.1 phospho-sugar mutase [Phycisphaerales bacterium]